MSLRWEIHIPFANHRTLVPLNRICPHFMQFHYFLMNFIEICVFLHAAGVEPGLLGPYHFCQPGFKSQSAQTMH